jgi:hypothetical protein
LKLVFPFFLFGNTALYTWQILTLPYENVSRIATKGEDANLLADSILPPKGGTIINYNGLIDKLRSVLMDNTKSESTDLKAFLL